MLYTGSGYLYSPAYNARPQGNQLPTSIIILQFTETDNEKSVQKPHSGKSRWLG